MRLRRGHTLVELSAALCAGSIVVGAAVAVGVQAERDRTFVGTLTEDAAALRRAVAAIEDDLRGAAVVAVAPGRLDAGTVAWRCDAGVLRRGDVAVARRVADFDVARDADGCVRVCIRLEPRTPGAARRAEIATCVLPRIDEARR